MGDRINAIKIISIHALREEGDVETGYQRTTVLYFNPRPPRGGRLDVCSDGQCVDGISIHALREEGDVSPGRTSST